ncbi:ATP-dependent helicase [Stenotrophomonas lacuserhaii]|uniref:ATP-dependent helicase n=1 Tax=Stenotrophomonas lacuserhaii TaxID=2760084 RepID=UPI0015F87B85|nr:ATP-dependent helicase [Stenotrophomonas lacuserhaii]
MPSSLDALPAAFAPATRTWFSGAFPAATPAQVDAWAAISQGQHTLVIAPTGSGKTLAAFLHAIDQLFTERDQQARTGLLPQRGTTRVLYISPIKALGADVQRNLQVPLQGVRAERARRGDPDVDLSVAIRSGDTTASERARLARRPPDILITTPESLFLMLTSNVRDTLRHVHTVIIDEIHAVAGSKRGTHLALSLERLENLLQVPAQRIGLSATVRPVDEVARFLGGGRAVSVVQPPSSRQLAMRIVVPVEDMADLPTQGSGSGAGESSARVGSIWPHVEASILEEVLRWRSTIVFANSRGVAEKLTARLNALYAERLETDAGGGASGQRDPTAFSSFNGGTAGRSTGAEPLLARSHHGSVSKEQRREIEEALKSGALRCVVATSSLELGIDMGLVDLVIQVAAPPSVASALQRVGRAGHQVGGISTGFVYPRTRRDLIDAAVIVDSMLAGRIEALDPPRNPLDVLAQQTVAAVAMDALDVEDWYACVRRAAPYRELPRSAFDAVLDMLAGRYPSDDFAGFRPRLVWNRDSGKLTARPGARQLAVTSGGTIPDRGMFSVVLPEGEERAGSRRVGELDEEMVHESRVNDVITLGATSWRVEQITHDQVIVTPAPGRSARLPFWRGENAGRPAELGAAIGAFLAELDGAATEEGAVPEAVAARLQASCLDGCAIANILGLLGEQRQATGVLPTDRQLVVERCRDELGDWRVMLHSPYGRRVHDPWALAIAERIRERWHVDPSVVSSEDGIMARIPDSSGHLPGADLFLFEPEPLRRQVTAAVGSSALFAARFRECASRALLLPRRTPGRRSPLWQQRLRAGQLLDVASAYPDFPILIETARECLQDVYDLDALGGLMQRLEAGHVQIAEVTTAVPSPFAANLLFGYVAEFMYGTDVPLAERRASILSLDSGLLADLLGQVDIGELLDAGVVERVVDELQRLAPDRRAAGKEGVADLLRELGPLSVGELAVRLHDADGDVRAHLAALQEEQRIIAVALAGEARWAAIEDAGRLRDALGIALPGRIPAVFLLPSPDPLGDLVARFARTRGPFTTADVAARFGLGVAVADNALARLAEQGKLLSGRFGATPSAHGTPLARHEWMAEAVFRRLRVRSLQAAREATRPVPGTAYVRLLLERHALLGSAAGHAALGSAVQVIGTLEGSEGVLRVVEQLAGVPLPVSAWENQVLPARVRDYAPALLDQLLATGSVLWCGHGTLGEDDGLVSLHLQQVAAETLPVISEGAVSPLQEVILSVLADGGGFFARQLATSIHARIQAADHFAAGIDLSPESLHAALWGLAWQGRVATDIWAPLRALSMARAPSRARASHASRRRRGFMGVPMDDAVPAAGVPSSGPATYDAPSLAGRWSLLQRDAANDTVRAVALAEALLDRHGVVTRGAAVAEGIAGGFPALQQVYRGMEDAGRVLRGRFVEGLGGAQFAERSSVDRLRDIADDTTPAASAMAIGLSAVDPANAYGTLLAWPAHVARQRPVRRSGALVVLAGGALRMYLAQGGRSLLLYFDGEDPAHADLLAASACALAAALRRGRRQSFTLDRINDAEIGRGPVTEALRTAGFRNAPRGLSWEG